jgi:hypothetical protein
MSTEDPGPGGGSATPPRRLSRRTLRAVVVVVLLSLGAGWLAHAYLSRAEPEPDAEDALALSIIGGWWNISGDRHLTLEWEGRRAWLRDYSKSDAGAESTGTWRTTKNNVMVHVTGAAGELKLELELVGNDAEMFLAPAPAAQARLLDSWIADHDEDDEDMSPSDSTAREARANGATDAILSMRKAVNEHRGARVLLNGLRSTGVAGVRYGTAVASAHDR